MIDKIKEMSDKELVSFINRMSQNKLMLCIKCGNPTSWNNRKTINVGIYNRSIGQKVKKLCTLCEECYIEMLDYLGICDVDWSDNEN